MSLINTNKKNETNKSGGEIDLSSVGEIDLSSVGETDLSSIGETDLSSGGETDLSSGGETDLSSGGKNESSLVLNARKEEIGILGLKLAPELEQTKKVIFYDNLSFFMHDGKKESITIEKIDSMINKLINSVVDNDLIKNLEFMELLITKAKIVAVTKPVGHVCRKEAYILSKLNDFYHNMIKAKQLIREILTKISELYVYSYKYYDLVSSSSELEKKLEQLKEYKNIFGKRSELLSFLRGEKTECSDENQNIIEVITEDQINYIISLSQDELVIDKLVYLRTCLSYEKLELFESKTVIEFVLLIEVICGLYLSTSIVKRVNSSTPESEYHSSELKKLNSELRVMVGLLLYVTELKINPNKAIKSYRVFDKCLFLDLSDKKTALDYLLRLTSLSKFLEKELTLEFASIIEIKLAIKVSRMSILISDQIIDRHKSLELSRHYLSEFKYFKTLSYF